MQIALGTVQLGMAYGVVNTTGALSEEQAIQILKHAYDSGIRHLDTARAYGNAENIVGTFLRQHSPQGLRIVTKIQPISHDGYDEAVRSLHDSLTALGLDTVDTMLLHRWQNRKDAGVMRALSENKKHFRILGVSALDCTEAIEALSDPEIKFIQLPANVLDWRTRSSPFIRALSSRSDVEIQVRSILLQGLLSGASIPEKFKARAIAEKLDAFVKKYDRKSRADLSYAYIRSLPWIDSIVFGVDNIAQLKSNLELFSESLLPQEAMEEVEQTFTPRLVSESLLMPHLWSTSFIDAKRS